MSEKQNKQILIDRVEKAQTYLKHKKVKDAKLRFFDCCYGSMYKAESDRVTNLWARKITDVEFTERLEEFVENLDSYTSENSTIDKYIRFAKWFKKIGGSEITKEQKELIYPKFKL